MSWRHAKTQTELKHGRRRGHKNYADDFPLFIFLQACARIKYEIRWRDFLVGCRHVCAWRTPDISFSCISVPARLPLPSVYEWTEAPFIPHLPGASKGTTKIAATKIQPPAKGPHTSRPHRHAKGWRAQQNFYVREQAQGKLTRHNQL